MKIEASEHVFPLLSLKDIVVFPHTIIPLFIENDKTVEVVSTAFEEKEDVLVCCRRQQAKDETRQDSIHSVGVSSSIIQLLRLP
nr:LON peptidase substrate-binding domain-containing protein [Deltaproteobacteria bacterium]